MEKMFKILLPMMIVATLFSETIGCINNSIGTPIPKRRPFSKANPSSHLSSLPDSRRLNTLALLGTHNSAASSTNSRFTRTQAMTITEQLEFGVRVFDMRVRRTSNKFAMHHGNIFLNKMFGDILRDIKTFLLTHPRELVILLMHEEYQSETSNLNECQILGNYITEGGSQWFVQNWSVGDNIGQHRGKILLGKGENGFSECTTSLPCAVQNFSDIAYWNGLSDKVKMIKDFQDRMFDPNEHSQCYINFLSANGKPWDSPISTSELMNQRMTSYFRNPKNTFYIVMADFPTPQLGQKIIDSN